ncbi:hypothetical protein [Mesorhizobium sp. WSM2239]|uniref:Uncharacterized protein n=2 Tax=unclassified Mesorhizobium TaxID=325217 RepID=A0AAU8DGQ2_9HYPH
MTTEWTTTHSEQAISEGWDIFEASGSAQNENGDRPFQLQALDEDEIFVGPNRDVDAWTHVYHHAKRGLPLHQQALNFLREHSLPEFEAVISECSTTGGLELNDGFDWKHVITIDDTRARFPGKLFAFAAVTTRSSQFGIGIAVLGEAGYSVPQKREVFPTYDAASDRADQLNKELGYTQDTALAIIADTMIRQSHKRDVIHRLRDVLDEAEANGTLNRLHIDRDTIDTFVEAVRDMA